MISYQSDRISNLFGKTGSVLPTVFWFCLPTFVLTALGKLFLLVLYGDIHKQLPEPNKVVIMGWSMYTTVLGFLVVFRANLAYSRYWEGSTLVENARSCWINAVSNLIAFCNASISMRHEVRHFQHLLARLTSLLFATSLAEVANDPNATLAVLGLDGFDEESLEYLDSRETKREVVLQWIQRLVIEGERSGILDVSSPIISRTFQELSNGIIHMNDARKLTIIPFPFPFAQVSLIMIGFFSYCAVPAACGLYLPLLEASLFSFICPAIFWVTYHITVEIEQPFGPEDKHCSNKLPVGQLQAELNASLLTLVKSQSQRLPEFTFEDDVDITTSIQIMRHSFRGHMSKTQIQMLSNTMSNRDSEMSNDSGPATSMGFATGALSTDPASGSCAPGPRKSNFSRSSSSSRSLAPSKMQSASALSGNHEKHYSMASLARRADPRPIFDPDDNAGLDCLPPPARPPPSQNRGRLLQMPSSDLSFKCADSYTSFDTGSFSIRRDQSASKLSSGQSFKWPLSL